YSMTTLFPELAHDPSDFEGIRNDIKRLMNDQEFYNKCGAYAFEQVEEMNHENSKRRLLEGMENWGIKL
ncbi:unnamed protein product, partial [marine sediment metagenome]